jgi:DNA polymerase epsilon subunit 1
VCAVNPKVARARGGSRDPFTLPDFDYKSTADCEYLETGALKRIYLHHNQSGSRAMFGLFIPETNKGYIFVVDPGRNDALPRVARVWSDIFAIGEQEGVAPMQPREIVFEQRVFENAKAAGLPLNNLLQNYSDERHGPTVLVVQSPAHLSNLQVSAPSSALGSVCVCGVCGDICRRRTCSAVLSDCP